MSHKDYDAMLAEKLGERPTFTLAGKDFTCRRKLHWTKQSKVFLTLANASGGDALNAASVDFVKACLVPADRAVFEALMQEPDDDYDEDSVITRDQLDELVNDLFDYYAGKAEPSDGDSSTSPPDAGPPSNVVSLNSKEA